MIKRQMFSSSEALPTATPGEVVFEPVNRAKTSSWVVPADVYLISAVLVCRGVSNGRVALSRGGVELLATDSAIGGSIGGGNGGAAATASGGGAGGYTGPGGAGAASSGSSGSAGSGGGGGGAGGGAGAGGGIGLQGQGANGAGGAPGSPGGTGSYISGLRAGGGENVVGGNTRWRNGIPVTPGETLTLTWAGSGTQGFGPTFFGNNGQGEAARIMWYGGRSYPSNAGDAVPSGQATITASNTTYTIQAGVTSICACAQQLEGDSAAVTLVVGGSTVLRAQNGARIGDGGGDGGAGGVQTSSPGNQNGGGGGGGGYTGPGGAGAPSNRPNPQLSDSTWTAGNGLEGSGGGGAGGYSDTRYLTWPTPPSYGYNLSGRGGNVGISGIGTNGAPNAPDGSSDPTEGNMGGGSVGRPGGALAWKNGIAVSPGQVITVNAAGGRVRIIWGPNRSYPSNAAKV